MSLRDYEYKTGTVTLTLEGDLGDVCFTLTRQYRTKPELVDQTVMDILTRGAETLHNMYTKDLGGNG